MKIFLCIFFLSFLLNSSVHAKTLNVAILAYDQMNILDFAGPTEVFADTGRILEKSGQRMNVYSVGFPVKQVRALEGTQLITDYTIADAPKPDLIIIPGGDPQSIYKRDELQSWIKNNSGPDQKIASVCTGALILAESGLLDGKEATTHHLFTQFLQTNYPKIIVKENTRYVETGNLLTTAGVSAGIDGALFLVNQYYGSKVEDGVRSIMEYYYR